MTTPSLAHLVSMSDGIGLFEHADHAEPRRERGYCTDDVARLLVASCRQPEPDRSTLELAGTAFRFLAESQGATGRTRNRRAAGGRWHGRRGVEDCWGRSVWAFGTAARHAPEEWMRRSSRSYFSHGATQRSPHLRAMAFAALGAAEMLAIDPRHNAARSLLADAVAMIDSRAAGPGWSWPEPRLSYANAVIPEVLIAGGHLLDRPAVLERGLDLLRWLLARETIDDHLSPTPVGGAGPDDHGPAFDQQPIEIAAIADACARAAIVTGDAAWVSGIDLAIGWFDGRNDMGTAMWDPVTGGGYDGLTAIGPNLNQGAESTLALVTTMQYAVADRATAAA